jgi:membrane protein
MPEKWVNRFKKLFSLFENAFNHFSEAKGTLMAAALAYYALFSISPLLVLTISLSRWLLGETGIVDELIRQISAMVTPAVAESLRLLVESYMNNAFQTLPTVISLGIMLFGASIVFVQLKTALNQIWGIVPRPNQNILFLLRTHGLAFASVMTLGLFLVSLTIATTILGSLRTLIFGQESALARTFPALDVLISIVIFTVAFALIFKILPDAQIAWRDVWLGALITAIAFTIGEFFLGLYLSRSSFSSFYGVAGSVIVLMVWIFYSSQILLFGAAFTKAYADLYGETVRPSKSAVLVNNSYTEPPTSESQPK